MYYHWRKEYGALRLGQAKPQTIERTDSTAPLRAARGDEFTVPPYAILRVVLN